MERSWEGILKGFESKAFNILWEEEHSCKERKKKTVGDKSEWMVEVLHSLPIPRLPFTRICNLNKLLFLHLTQMFPPFPLLVLCLQILDIARLELRQGMPS